MYITLSFYPVILFQKLILIIQLYVYLVQVHLLKSHCKMRLFNWVKLARWFSHFPIIHNSIHKTIHTNKTIHNLLITLWITTPTLLHPPTLLFCRTHYTTTTPTTLNGSNNTHNNTTHANNITTLQHIKKPATTNTVTTQH